MRGKCGSLERTVIGRQISASGRQKDCLVYDFYGLTDEEIRIVEEATAKTLLRHSSCKL
jgi:hypothetical protein